MANPHPSRHFPVGHTGFGTRRRKPVGALGEMLDGLLKEKGWTTRDLAQKTVETRIGDELPERIPHQHICRIINGRRNPGERILNRLLRPFGYTALYEVRIQPIETKTFQSNNTQ